MRSRTIRWKLAAGLAALLLPLPGFASELTFEQALDLALSRSRSLTAQRSRVAEQEAALKVVKAARWPAIVASQRLTRLDDSTVDRANSAADGLSLLIGADIPPFVFENSFRTQLDFSMPLWTAGGLAAAIDGERATLDARQAGQEAVERSLRALVVQRFFGLATARQVGPARTEALRRAERRLAEAEHRLEVGMTTRQEVLRWKVELERAHAALAEVSAEEMVAHLELTDLLELPPGEGLELALPTAETVDSLLAWADGLDAFEVMARAEAELDELPEMRAARAQQEAAGDFVRGARSARRPRLDAAASVGWLENDTLQPDEFTGWSATVLLTVPLDLRGDLRARIAGSQARQRAAETAVDDTRSALRLALGRALAEVVRVRSRLRSARRAEEETLARRELLARQAGVGVVTLLDLIDADTTLAAVQVEHAAARVRLLAAVAALEISWPGADPPAGGLIP